MLLGIGTAVVALTLAGGLVWTLWPSPKASPSPQVSAAPQLAQVGEMTGSVQAGWIKYSPDGEILAALNEDRTVQLWDVADRKQVGQALGPFRNGPVGHGLSDLVFSPGNRALITNEIDGENSVTRQWEVASGQQIGESLIVDIGSLALHLWPALSPDGRTLAVYYVGSESERGIQLWDVAGRQQTGHFEGIEGDWGSVMFSPDSRTLFAFETGTLTQWDVSSAQPVGNPISAPTDEGIDTYAISPDGAVLVTMGGDLDTSSVRLWDTSSHNQIRQPITIPGGYDSRVALSPDGKTLAMISDDTMRLWNINSGHEIASALDNVSWMAFSPDGHTLATTPATGKSVRLWRVPTS